MRVPDPHPETMVKYHFIMLVVWASLLIPTVLFWKESILWVAFMSLYANFASHFAGLDAAKAGADIKQQGESNDA